MKRDIDILMRQQHADALWISGAALHNPSMVYFTKGIHVTQADLFYRPVRNPFSFAVRWNAMKPPKRVST